MAKRPAHLGVPNIDNLPETAQRIVDASLKLLAEKGWKALTVPAISEAAGVYTPAISYYFGGKPGLILVLFDSLMRKSTRAMIDAVQNAPAGVNRVDAIAQLLDAQWRTMGPDGYAAYFETFPHLLRNKQARELTIGRNAAYEEAIVRSLSRRDDPETLERLRPYAALLLAVLDGLAARRLLEPQNDLFDRAVAVFSSLLTEGLPTALDPEREG